MNQPCCLRYFYQILYNISVRWNYALRNSFINGYVYDKYEGDIEYYNKPNTNEFKLAKVSAWILANMGLLFCFHLIILLVYIIFKLLSVLKSGFFKNAIRIIEFTVLIVFFFLFHMQIFVFSTLNLKLYGPSNHSFFIFCLLISIGYIVVFSLFWLYSVFRLTGSSFYF